MKKKILFLLVFITQILFAQDKRKIFYGIVSDNMSTLSNVHITNTTTNKATFSNDKGVFKLFAQVNDSLRVTSVGYKTKTILVTINHFGIIENRIQIKKEIIELDEIELKKHNLNGILSSDVKQTPKDIGAIRSKKALDFSKIDFNKKVILKIDEMNRAKAPDARKTTDPTTRFAGVGGTVGDAAIDGYAAAKRKMRKTIKFKESFPKKLLSEFGSQFFFDELKIPKEKYLHFLEYCNPLGIEKLYKDGKAIQLVKIFDKQSKSYLKLIKKQ